jgi:hypothetical protein
MPIPSFDASGNLPVGDLFAAGAHHPLVPASLQEVHERFVVQVPDSSRRSRVWEGWMRHRRELEQVGIQYATLVDGSFATIKQEPGDVDLCILYDAAEVNALGSTDRATLLRLLGGPACKPGYLCDVYGLSIHPLGDPRFSTTLERFAYWMRVFGTDRQDRQKSFLLVSERGIL